VRAVVPTLLATTFFEPQAAGDDAFEDFGAAEEVDAGHLRLPRHTAEPKSSRVRERSSRTRR
jgi:hypothetical protein